MFIEHCVRNFFLAVALWAKIGILFHYLEKYNYIYLYFSNLKSFDAS